MRVSKTNCALGIIIVSYILLFMNFFDLIEGIRGPDDLFWPFLVGMLILISSNIDSNTYALLKTEVPFLKKYSITVIFSLVIIVAGTSFIYQQGITRTLREMAPYVMFLMAIPMLMYIIRKNSINALVNITNVMAIIWFVLIILQKYIFQITGVIFFASSFEYGMRDGIRIGISCIGNLSIIINFHQLIFIDKDKRCKFPKIVCVLGFYALIVLQQTRALTFAICASCLLMILSDTRHAVQHKIKKWLILIFAVGIVFSTGILSSFLESFAEESEYGYSTMVRADAINYYWNIFKENPLFGFGFVSVADHESLIRGPRGAYFLNDVGLIGQLVRLGVFIIPIYFWPVLRFITITFRTKKCGTQAEYSLLVGLTAFVLITSASVIMIDRARSIGMPICLAIFEYQQYKNNSNIKTV